MNKIMQKEKLSESIYLMVINAPLIAQKAKAGQFVIVRPTEQAERIPLTIADYDLNLGSITIVYQIVGATTLLLHQLEINDSILDVVGPLGKPSEFYGAKSAVVVGGGVGCAIAYPIAKELKRNDVVVTTILGFRSKELVFFEEEFKAVSNDSVLMTDDGSKGKKGLVTTALSEVLNNRKVDLVITIGPLLMMKAVSEITKPLGVKTVASMNSIMIDGTGMCGGCRVVVNNRMCFACVDGPEFDAHDIDFDNAISRSCFYKEKESADYRHICNLLKKD